MQKRMKSLIIVFMSFVLSLISINNLTTITVEAEELNVNETTLTFLQTSDIHGRYVPWDYSLDRENMSGSFSQISTIVNQMRVEDEDLILLDAGDTIQGNSARLFKDEIPHPATEAMNYMKYDVWTLGNHEFDYGFEVLDNIVEEFNGPALAGNVYKDNGERYFDAYTILERKGIKIGVIGVTTPMVAEFKEDTDIFDGKELRNAVEETKKVVKELEGQVDVLVALAHMGIQNENNVPDTGVADMANAIPELDVIFSGHMHTLHEEEFINDVLIVQPRRYGTHVAKVDLTLEVADTGVTVKSKKGSAIDVSKYESDKKLEAILEPFHSMARADANKVIGELVGMDMVPENEIKGIPQFQIEETPLTNFFNEVMMHYSNADVVAHQIDNDNARLDMGPITQKDINYNYQYDGGEVTEYKVTGKDLKDYMEWSANYFNQLKDGDVTISFNPERRASKYSTHDIFGGVKYTMDLRNESGNRITNLTYLDGTPIKPDSELVLGINAYRMEALIAKGGPLEGRVFPKLASTQDEDAFGVTEGRIRALAARYIQEEKNGVYEAYLNNTWEIIGIDQDNPIREDVRNLVNAGILDVPSTNNGQYTNTSSININEDLSVERRTELAKKAEVSEDNMKQLLAIRNAGDFYHALNSLLSEEAEKIGWIKDGPDWYYYNDNGVMQTGWNKVGPTWYYMAANGVMQTGWIKSNNTWYYLNSSGVMQTGWTQTRTGGTWYYMNASGAMQTGWNKIGGSWYYLNSSGAMQTGWTQTRTGGTWYYMNSSGVMQTGWNKVGNTWYYMSNSGAMQTGWNKVGNTWYYMSNNGAMQTGWNKVGPTWYYMLSSGAMQTGWIKSNSHWYYLNSDGSLEVGNKTINGTWYRFNSSGRIVRSIRI